MQNAEWRMENEQRFRVQGSGQILRSGRYHKAATVGRANSIANWQIANCKLQIADRRHEQWAVAKRQAVSIILHPSSFILHPSSHPSRRGISLMEVLISIFVLSIGLLGVAALIPLGQIGLVGNGQGRSVRGLRPGRFARNPSQPHARLPLLVLDAEPDNIGNYWGYYPPLSAI